MVQRILVTGATGLVGGVLVEELVARGYRVHVLSRSNQQDNRSSVRFFRWDVAAGYVEPGALDGIAGMIHLAGENIAALPWSKSRKRAIVSSRADSIALLLDQLRKQGGHQVSTLVSASASGYYELDQQAWMTEAHPPADGFLGRACQTWEQAVAEGRQLGLRTVSLRSGVVLSADGGLYQKFAGFTKKGIGVIPGTGQQWLPWIHVHDAVAMYLFALETSRVQGAYNMAAPQPATFTDFVRAVAGHQQKNAWLLHVPAFLLKGVLGQMSELLLGSTRLSVEKVSQAGFRFQYPELAAAIASL